MLVADARLLEEISGQFGGTITRWERLNSGEIADNIPRSARGSTMPLSARTQKFIHYIGYVHAIIPGIVGAVLLAISFTAAIDEAEGKLALAAIGLFLLGLGYFQIRRHSQADLTTPIYTVDDMPLDQRRTSVLRGAIVLAILFGVVSAFIAYQLASVEYGWAESAYVWPGIMVMFYELLGFWPAVLLAPALGLAVLVASARKLRQIKAAQASGKTIQ